MSSNVDAIIKQADWDVSKLRDKLCRDIEEQAAFICNEKLSELIAKYEVTYLGSMERTFGSFFFSYVALEMYKCLVKV